MLDFRIDTFLCVCKYMNYTKAAENLSLTQPAVSQHIKFLEEFYGTKLFLYSKKTLTLTKSGKLLRDSMLSMRHDELYLKDKMNNSVLPKLKFGATLSIGEFLLPEKLAEYLAENSNTGCDLTIADTKALLGRLNDGTIDFALVEGYFNKSEYDYRLIKTEKFVAVCGKNYQIDKINRFEDLFKHNLLIREHGSGTREVFTNYMAEHGFSIEHFKKYSVFNSMNIIKHLLKKDLGISFMYEIVVKDDLENGVLKKIEIPNFEVSHEFNFIWRKNSIFSEYYQQLFEKTIGK